MDVIHFTHGATDPLEAVGIHGAYFLPLADGAGDAHVGCVHLDPGARVESPSITHAAALLRGISSPQRIAGQTWPSDALIPK